MRYTDDQLDRAIASLQYEVRSDPYFQRHNSPSIFIPDELYRELVSSRRLEKQLRGGTITHVVPGTALRVRPVSETYAARRQLADRDVLLARMNWLSRIGEPASNAA